ncbi:nuclear transcription factor Y subunit C-3 [Photinus pyralis]|uniref:Transcription factor CBF/NF-Y/archaeal histone domain-containing protein n=1 Tax=Photinus pyralis TaxID=7054 RepID=A0A1Y1N097_PHOPY|nr:nuclear transcription factor Y subunit C-3 [Photinus pyralis]
MAGHFKLQRVRKIMKSSAEVEHISKDSVTVVTRAAELFIMLLLKEAHTDPKKVKKLEYKNIANVVNDSERYEFAREMIPHKIKVHEYYEIMKKKYGKEIDTQEKHSSSESSSSSNSSEPSSTDNSDSEDSKDGHDDNSSNGDVMIID